MCSVLRLNNIASSYSIGLFIQRFWMFTNFHFVSLFLYSFFLLDVFASGVWAFLNDLREPSLTGQVSRLQSTVIASRAPGTTDAYRRAFTRWKNYASSIDEIQAFPAKTEHVALYLQHLLDTTHSHSAVDSAIYGIKWAHNLAGLPSPTDSSIIHDVSRAAKILIGTRLINKKEPILPDMIRKLVEASNLDNLLNLRNVCIFLLAFAGFFRIEEVLSIKYGDITFHDSYVVIRVDRSKTDQLRKGNEVVISRSSSQDACPVLLFKRYLSELERFPVEPSHYVFKPLTKSKLGHKFVSTNRPISYSTVREYFKSSFKDIVPDIAVFSTHSLRSGGASAAANAGVADRLFQRHGRWKSVSAKNGYIDDNLESRLLVSQHLGI